MKIKDFLEAIDYKITGADEFCWTCYGEHPHRLEYWDGSSEGVSVDMIFDTRTQAVYEVSAIDYAVEQAFRWVHPDYRDDLDEDAEFRGVDSDAATDTIKYHDVDDEGEIIEQLQRVVNYRLRDTEQE